MNPNAKLIARSSASVTAGTALPASVRVAITEPGPTRTNAAVPNASASARCDIECILPKAPFYLTSVRQCRTDFTNRSPARGVCQQLIGTNPPIASPPVRFKETLPRLQAGWSAVISEWNRRAARFHIDTGQLPLQGGLGGLSKN